MRCFGGLYSPGGGARAVFPRSRRIPFARPSERPVRCGRLGDLRILSAPALSEGPRRGGYRDACSIARSLRGLLDACSILRRGNPIARSAPTISILRSRALRMSPMCRVSECSIRNHYTARRTRYDVLIPVYAGRSRGALTWARLVKGSRRVATGREHLKEISHLSSERPLAHLFQGQQHWSLTVDSPWSVLLGVE
jgi:hypothetical protein